MRAMFLRLEREWTLSLTTSRARRGAPRRRRASWGSAWTPVEGNPVKQLNRSQTAIRAAGLMLALSLAACSDAPTGAAPASGDATLAQQVAALGFRADMIEDHGDFVLVEGDIHLTRAQLRAVPLGSDNPLRPRFQYHTTGLVSPYNVHDIRVDLSALDNLPGGWASATREALTHWNGISNSYVLMTEGGPADVTVRASCISPVVAAYASFPEGGNTGPNIYVNACFGSTTHAQRVRIMVHELGHTLGFRHSNYVQNGETAGTEGAVHVANTPTSGNDPASVMNGGTASASWAGFSAGDVTAVQAMYPVPASPPPAPPAPPAMSAVTVTNSGGTPLLGWTAVPGATSYKVAVVVTETRTNRQTAESSTYVDEYARGSTTGSSFLDTGHTYTGTSMCTYSAYPVVTRRNYRYRVTAIFANGTSLSTAIAPIAQC